MVKVNLSGVAAGALLLAGCATMPAMQNVATVTDPVAREAAYQELQANSPKPIEGNAGKYMSPFTTDGVTAEWVTKAMKVQASGAIGEAAGQVAANQLLSNIPFAGMFGGMATKSIARSAAMNSIGGEEFLRSSSDLSFNSLPDMAAYMYAFHSSHPEYPQIVKATAAIYPDFSGIYAAGYPRP